MINVFDDDIANEQKYFEKFRSREKNVKNKPHGKSSILVVGKLVQGVAEACWNQEARGIECLLKLKRVF